MTLRTPQAAYECVMGRATERERRAAYEAMQSTPPSACKQDYKCCLV